MTHDELIAQAPALAGATEDYPFGDDLLTAKVGGKVFPWIPLTDSGRLPQGAPVAVKLPADLVTELRHVYPTQVRPARPLDQRYWVTLPPGTDLPDNEVLDLLAWSWREVVARLPLNRRPNDPGRLG
jgi:predicted DNA-binding protein (MmcQ/YjbR family)